MIRTQSDTLLEPHLLGGLGEMKSNGGTQYYQQDRVYSSESIAMAHPAQIPDGSYKYMVEVRVIGQMDNTLDHTYESANRVYDINGLAPTCNTCGGGGLHTKILKKGSDIMGEGKTEYRIRKLTPRECFRLMGVRDDDYNKLTVSDTQKYKQAGNSIVVDVLSDIFTNLFVNECKKNRLF